MNIHWLKHTDLDLEEAFEYLVPKNPRAAWGMCRMRVKSYHKPFDTADSSSTGNITDEMIKDYIDNHGGQDDDFHVE